MTLLWLLLLITTASVVVADSCSSDIGPLIAGVNGISDEAFSASTSWDKNWGPEKARMTNHGHQSGVWHAAANGYHGAWIQVAFRQLSKVCRIQTKGRVNHKQYIKTYSISTSRDCLTFTDYKEGGAVKIFTGNTDPAHMASNTLRYPVDALCFRLTAISYHWTPALRLEVLGKPLEKKAVKTCPSDIEPLVSGRNPIPDSAMTSSSKLHNDWGPEKGRITNNGGTLWHPATNGYAGCWLQVRFRQLSRVCSIQTKGRQGIHKQFTTKYSISTSIDCQTFLPYREYGVVKIFSGNVDQTTLASNTLRHPVDALCLRVMPTAYTWVPVLRLEVLGKPITNEYCSADGAALVAGVKDSALTASTFYSYKHAPSQGRLNTAASSSSAGAWCARTKKAGDWIQVRFSQLTSVCSVKTQGRGSISQWIKKFYIQTSTDCSSFATIKENGQDKVFYGNKDRNSVVTNALPGPTKALCVRVKVIAFNRHPCMRFGLLGAKSQAPCSG